MELRVARNYEEMSLIAATYVASIINNKPDAHIGLTTGRTPEGLYAILADWNKQQKVNFTRTHIYSLEEYLGVSPRDPHSLYHWLERMFLVPCHIRDEQVLRIDAQHIEPHLACANFDAAIALHGGLDLVIEGIGTNGHIGYNEPGSDAQSVTRIVKLTNETLDYNFDYWNQQVPTYGMTIGMKPIIEAKHVILMASGQRKAQALALALQGPLTSDCPASYLQLAQHLIVIADEAAASMLSHIRGGA
jgi:glucosamine-6-phosphate deaminase